MPSPSQDDVYAHRIIRRRSSRSAAWPSVLGLKPQVTWRNAVAFLVHCSASILFLVFLNASQPFLIHQLESMSKQAADGDLPSRAGSMSGSLIFCDELLSTFTSLVWGALAELVGLATVTSTSYLFIAVGLVSYTIPTRPWPDLVPARLVFALGGSGVTAMLSGILSEYSDSPPAVQASTEQDAEWSSDTTLCANSRQDDTDVDAAEQSRLLRTEQQAQLSYRHNVIKGQPKCRHGRVAAVAGVFTGLGALMAVFVLIRLPEKIADYLEHHEPALLLHKANEGLPGDKLIRRATIVTFWLVAALALLTASVTAIGLKQPKGSPRRFSTAEARFQRSGQRQQDYGTLLDSTIAIADDSRQARRARMRERQQRRTHAAWANVIRLHLYRFLSASVGGFRMAGPLRRTANVETTELDKRLAWELRVAYLGGALARAFTIGTTAFLPLLVSHYYYSSGLCRQLPSPDPKSPLPNDELKKLCRGAFTATAILGGTAQLTALLTSPLIGLLCDTFSPSTTISVTSALGAVGFYLLGVGTSGFGGDKQTGEEVPDPLTILSIAAAVLVGIGQIGAIVASLAGCARAKSLVVEKQIQTPADEAAHTASAHDAGSSSSGTNRWRPQSLDKDKTGQGAGAIAGAYSCTGSLSILFISKAGGLLFDMYVPSPFLLIGGFSALVALCGAGVSTARRLKRLQGPSQA